MDGRTSTSVAVDGSDSTPDATLDEEAAIFIAGSYGTKVVAQHDSQERGSLPGDVGMCCIKVRLLLSVKLRGVRFCLSCGNAMLQVCCARLAS